MCRHKAKQLQIGAEEIRKWGNCILGGRGASTPIVVTVHMA